MAGRHGANIPDIRALSGSLSSIDVSLNRAFPDTEPFRGFMGFMPGETRGLIQPNVVVATIYNPSPADFTIGPAFGAFATLAAGESLTVENAGADRIYAHCGDVRGELFVDGRRSLYGAFTGQVDARISTGISAFSILGSYATPYRTTVYNDEELQTFDRTGTLINTVDLTAIGTGTQSNFLITPDYVAGGNRFLTVDSSDDVYSVNADDGTATLLFNVSGAQAAYATRGSTYRRYVIPSSAGTEVFDADGNSLFTDTSGAQGSQWNERRTGDAGRYFYVRGSDSGDDVILIADFQTGAFDTFVLPSGYELRTLRPTPTGFVLRDDTSFRYLRYEVDTATQTEIPLEDITNTGDTITDRFIAEENDEALFFAPVSGDFFFQTNYTDISVFNNELSRGCGIYPVVDATDIILYDALDLQPIGSITRSPSEIFGLSGTNFDLTVVNGLDGSSLLEVNTVTVEYDKDANA